MGIDFRRYDTGMAEQSLRRGRSVHRTEVVALRLLPSKCAGCWKPGELTPERGPDIGKNDSGGMSYGDLDGTDSAFSVRSTDADGALSC
jgi:hypothetical protein